MYSHDYSSSSAHLLWGVALMLPLVYLFMYSHKQSLFYIVGVLFLQSKLLFNSLMRFSEL